MIRVYIAGAYSGPDFPTIQGNMRRGLALARDVMRAGYAPFCPWLDFQYGLAEDFPVETYQAVSMAWLEASDAVLIVQQGAEQSKGTQAEIQRAGELGIPVFEHIDLLRACFRWEEVNATESNA